MANIRMDKRSTNNENSQYAIQMKSQKNALNVNRSAKKQAFGEIKNVIHNQINATPFKGNASKIDGLPSVFSSSSLCNEVLRKQQMKQNFADAQSKLEKKYKTESAAEQCTDLVFDESMFDSWDRNRECCQKQKSDMEIWSEMDFLDINFANCKIDKDKDDNGFFVGTTVVPELDELTPMSFDLDPMDALNFDDDLPTLPVFDQFDELSF